MKDRQPVTHFLKNYEPPHYLVANTKMLVQLYEEGARITTTLNMHRNPLLVGAAPLVLDGAALKLEHIVLNGRDLSATEYSINDSALTIDGVPDVFELTTTTWILPQENTCLEGLYRSSKLFCTQCEAEGFRRITYYPDRPDVMACFTVTIEAEKSQYPVLLSNGNPEASGNTRAGRHWVTWSDPYPKPSYLFALVAGDLRWVEDHFTTASGRNVTLRIYVESQNLAKCDHAMASLKRSMRWDEEAYGREYDLERFNIVAVSDFNMGAMENKGLNIFNASCVLANPQTATDAAFERIESIVAHEYFHNWSGNRVTCRDWFQLSLKEGFTVFRDSAYTANRYGQAVKRIDDATVMRTQQFAEDAGPMAHPIRPDSYMEISNFYTLTVYEKGAEVVGMLHRLLGAETFRKATDLYFEKYDGQAVTTEDFVACMEAVSGRDLTQFKLWYSQAGTPQLEIEDRYNAKKRTYTLTVRQYTPPTRGQSDKAALHIPLEIALFYPDGTFCALEKPVLEICAKSETHVFSNVEHKPIPSLLRHFSAPVKVSYPYTRQQLSFLMCRDTDGFSRWDAGQTLAIDVLMEQIQAVSAGRVVQPDPEYVKAWCDLFADPQKDAGLQARLIQVPSVAMLVERLDCIDIDAVLAAREQTLTALAAAASGKLWQWYQVLMADEKAAPEDMSPIAMGRRALKNQCLAMLAFCDDSRALRAATWQQDNARLMTEEQGALAALLQSHDRDCTAEGLDSFFRRWQKDALVMESWFSLQAGSQRYTGIEHIRGLTRHPLFSERNPNKVRCVVSTFASQNWRGFHAADGSGYEFLQQWILRMNRLNPQIAARLVTPLTRWRKFVPTRAAMMQEVLQQLIREKDLSKDVYEVVFKSLE